MRRLHYFQIALAMACALTLGHLGDKLPVATFHIAGMK